MGLSGRREKQRIGKDPRNLSWADDASRFGQAYLEKFGWDASKGLGASGEGRTNAIKATQKLDMLGIGMRQQSNLEGGIAWRQNRDFEDLLRRLNDGTTTETTTTTTNSAELLLDSFHKARARESESEALEKVKDDDSKSDGEEEREGVIAKKEKKKKKRKATAAEGGEEVEERGDGLDRKERKKRRKKSSSRDDDDDGRAPVPSSIESEPPPPRSRPSSREAPPAKESRSVQMDTSPNTATRPTTTVTAPVPVRAPPRTHRARIIAAKRMAASNSTALAEILGIPSSSSSSARPSAVASPLPDPALTLATTAIAAATSTATTFNNETAAATFSETKDLLQNLTTSSQSVGDYFKAKLNAKAHGGRQARPTSAAASASARDDHDNDDGRAGLGSGLGFGGGPSRIPPPPDGLVEEPARGGIGTSSLSMFATMFIPRQATNAQEENTATAGVEDDASDYDDNPKKSEKRLAKEERRRKKEERRRKRAEAEAGQCVDRVAVPAEDGARAARSKKKDREPETPDDRLEDTQNSGADRREAIATKKRKKDKKSSKHRGLED